MLLLLVQREEVLTRMKKLHHGFNQVLDSNRMLQVFLVFNPEVFPFLKSFFKNFGGRRSNVSRLLHCEISVCIEIMVE